MVEMTPIQLNDGIAIGISISYPKTRLLSITTDVGYIMCGVLNIVGIDSLHAERKIIAARVTGVKSFEDMLKTKVVEATQEAQKLGIIPNISTGEEALGLMLQYSKTLQSEYKAKEVNHEKCC